jgi:hypothetical protein
VALFFGDKAKKVRKRAHTRAHPKADPNAQGWMGWKDLGTQNHSVPAMQRQPTAYKVHTSPEQHCAFAEKGSDDQSFGPDTRPFRAVPAQSATLGAPMQ